MKKSFFLPLSALLIFTSTIASGQILDRTPPNLLEPLMPFAEAVEMAKANNPKGWFALFIHYAKGQEIERDTNTAFSFLEKAADSNYGNAVFIKTLCEEYYATTVSSNSSNSRHFPPLGRKEREHFPRIHQYIGTTPFFFNSAKRSLTNANDVTAIRNGYTQAFNLGVLYATNELARFEKRMEYELSLAQEKTNTEKTKSQNAVLAESLLHDNKETSKSTKSPSQQNDNNEQNGSLFSSRRFTRLSSRLRNREVQPLEPLLPLSEAVEKAKSNDPRGWFSLGIHYAKGEEIDNDFDKARLYITKASDLNYSNAVFTSAMILESRLYGLDSFSDRPKIFKYLTDDTKFRSWHINKQIPITNAQYIAKVRAEYKRAFKLGVLPATNELARFESKVKQQIEILEKKSKNRELVKSIQENLVKDIAIISFPENTAKNPKADTSLQILKTKNRETNTWKIGDSTSPISNILVISRVTTDKSIGVKRIYLRSAEVDKKGHIISISEEHGYIDAVVNED